MNMAVINARLAEERTVRQRLLASGKFRSLSGERFGGHPIQISGVLNDGRRFYFRARNAEISLELWYGNGAPAPGGRRSRYQYDPEVSLGAGVMEYSQAAGILLGWL